MFVESETFALSTTSVRLDGLKVSIKSNINHFLLSRLRSVMGNVMGINDEVTLDNKHFIQCIPRYFSLIKQNVFC
jgi:hypothetical protein